MCLKEIVGQRWVFVELFKKNEVSNLSKYTVISYQKWIKFYESISQNLETAQTIRYQKTCHLFSQIDMRLRLLISTQLASNATQAWLRMGKSRKTPWRPRWFLGFIFSKLYTLKKEFCYKIHKYSQVNQIYEYDNSACSGMFLGF